MLGSGIAYQCGTADDVMEPSNWPSPDSSMPPTPPRLGAGRRDRCRSPLAAPIRSASGLFWLIFRLGSTLTAIVGVEVGDRHHPMVLLLRRIPVWRDVRIRSGNDHQSGESVDVSPVRVRPSEKCARSTDSESSTTNGRALATGWLEASMVTKCPTPAARTASSVASWSSMPKDAVYMERDGTTTGAADPAEFRLVQRSADTRNTFSSESPSGCERRSLVWGVGSAPLTSRCWLSGEFA